ncbi:MAG: oligosaccharide flippase family protein [Prevotella sp.]|nr:oligosaccharide flippase family protein [Prevotella sp.]
MKKTNHSDSYSHILKYTGLFGGVQIVGILMLVARNKLAAVILGPQGMGLIALFQSTIKLISESTGFGLSMSAVKNISRDFDGGDHSRLHDTIRTVRTLSLLTAILGFIVCLVLSPFISRFTFSWQGHTLHFALLAPAVALTAIIGGEMAVLKGVRQLKRIAAVTVYNVFAALIISVPIYWFFGIAGIVPSLVLMVLAQAIITMRCSYKLYPLSLSRDRGVIGRGFDMIRLGTAFLVAGLFATGADFLIRSYINNVAQIETVGLYNAAFMMTMTYAGMVFTAMETDYFPRLSSVKGVGNHLNATVNRQIEVALLLLAPMLAAFMVAMPILLPMLYSGKFLPALGMTQVVVLAMYFRAIKLPIAYLPLAKGDSRLYMSLEGVYYIVFLALTIYLFDRYGLLGCGMAILALSVMDFLVQLVMMYAHYDYRLSGSALRYILIQIPLGIVTYVMTYINDGIMYWCINIPLVILSLVISIVILRRKTDAWNSIIQKFRKNNIE